MSTSNFLVSAFLASTLLGSASAHMMLANPVPYGKSTLDTSPLNLHGTDFPCKQRAGVYEVEGAKNSYAAGAQVPISFKGSASHGGGSCQFALTTDKEPTASSTWQVIHSIEGGCPIKDATGNDGSDNYTVTIPSNFPPGDYAFGWTWQNRIGNREMYMNCAPMTITAGSSSKTKRNIEARKAFPLTPKENIVKRDNSSGSYPGLYLVNICGQGSGSCQTPDNDNLAYPNPGDSVEKLGPVSQTLATATCSCPIPTGTGSASSGSSGSGSSGSGASSAVMTSAASVETAAASSSSEDSGAGVLSTAVATATVVSTASSASATGSSDSASGSSSGSSSSSVSGSSSSNSTTSSTSSTGGTQTCDGSATVICSADGTQFGLCNNGSALMQAVAAGTKCVGGNIVAA